ncbi:MAG: hypothetical protein EKK64_08605 [Neisseriaceae bacterium]|nr:MAG: hypothetical protein EKK64_08605 [Neisseriaceae bacterium]
MQLYNKDKMTLWSKNNYLAGHRIFDKDNIIWNPIDNRILKPLENIPSCFYEIRNFIRDEFDFQNELERKPATSLGGIMFKDGYVESHVDSSVENFDHFRANVFASSEKGGFPIIDGEIFHVEKGDLIIFQADYFEHSTTIQESENPRVIISYPFIVPKVSNTF